MIRQTKEVSYKENVRRHDLLKGRETLPIRRRTVDLLAGVVTMACQKAEAVGGDQKVGCREDCTRKGNPTSSSQVNAKMRGVYKSVAAEIRSETDEKLERDGGGRSTKQ